MLLKWKDTTINSIIDQDNVVNLMNTKNKLEK
jgi:hypothetical protein